MSLPSDNLTWTTWRIVDAPGVTYRTAAYMQQRCRDLADALAAPRPTS